MHKFMITVQNVIKVVALKQGINQGINEGTNQGVNQGVNEGRSAYDREPEAHPILNTVPSPAAPPVLVVP